MFNTVPASYFTKVNPGVISAGGNGLALVGLFITSSTRVPYDTVLELTSSAAVGAYFGTTSTEYAQAVIYFNGFDGSSIKPGSLLFAQYPTANVAAWLRGGAVGASLTLAQLQALAVDTLTLTVDGAPITSGNINLSTATSFSNAATIIQAAFTTPPFTVTYDSIAEAFVFTTTLTGATATISFATSAGALSTELMLTSATGAVTSQGAAAATPAAFMDNIVKITTNFATFMTLFNPDVTGFTNKQAFANWNNGKNYEFIYVCWDTDITATTTVPATASLGYALTQAAVNGTELIYDPTNSGTAAFFCGMVASINFTELNGNVNPTYRGQSGLTTVVTDQTVLDNLVKNGYNAYVASSTAAQPFNFYFNGQITGKFLWAQPYINQIWMNSNFQLALMTLLTSAKSIPYNKTGDGMVYAALLDPIKAAEDFGAIQTGIDLSASQIAAVNNQAGLAIDSVLYTQGWYLQILPSTAATRQARATPPVKFWYTDGGSVQQITMASVDIL